MNFIDKWCLKLLGECYLIASMAHVSEKIDESLSKSCEITKSLATITQQEVFQVILDKFHIKMQRIFCSVTFTNPSPIELPRAILFDSDMPLLLLNCLHLLTVSFKLLNRGSLFS